MAVDFKYRAFISYSHADHKTAVWLHKALEKYPIHKKLVGLQTPNGTTAKRIGRVFRDEAELGAVPELGPKIEAALQDSDTLIVLCSPKSAQSQWVAQEVSRFKELGRQNRVLALILDGEPHASDPSQECFPEPLKRSPDGTPVQPLAVDIRKFGREDALVRLVSGILEIEYDQLKQRDLQRRRAEMRRAQGLFAAGLILLASALGAGFLALRGFSDLAHAQSDILAREAKIIFDNGDGDKTKSLLMALQADPAATRSLIRQVFSGTNGYPLARARLVGAHASRRFVRILRGHTQSVDDVAYAPDGATLVTTSWDRTAKLWDASTGQLLRSINGGEFFGLAAAFAKDGTAIFIAQDTIIQIWNLDTDALRPLETGHTANIVDLDVSENGQYLASAAWDASAKVWDLTTEQVILTLDDHQNIVSSVAFSPNSRVLATGSGDIGNGEVKLWAVETGELLQTLSGHSDFVAALAWSPKGDFLASAAGDNSVKIWDMSGSFEMYTLRGHEDVIVGMDFSPDGNLLVTASADGTIRIWDPLGGTLVAIVSGHQGGLSEIAFAPDGESFTTASGDGTARTWNTRPGELITKLELPDNEINLGAVSSASYAPDGEHILTGHEREAALLWDAQTGALVNTYGVAGSFIAATEFSPNGAQIATGVSDATIRIWNRQTGDLLQTLVGHNSNITTLSFAPDGATLISGDEMGFVFVWDLNTGRMRNIIPTGTSTVDTLKFAPDGQSFVTLDNAGQSVTWDVATGTQISTFSGNIEFTGAVDFSPTQNFIITGNMSGQVREWDLTSNALRTTYSASESSVWAVAYAPDGKFVVAGTGYEAGGVVKIWDTKTGEEVMEFLGNSIPVTQVAIAPDARSIMNDNAIGGGDRLAADVWKVPEIIHATPKQQVRIACETLWAANAPLHFTQADAQEYPVLLGEPIDPETGDFLSPCLGVLPDEAFVR